MERAWAGLSVALLLVAGGCGQRAHKDVVASATVEAVDIKRVVLPTPQENATAVQPGLLAAGDAAPPTTLTPAPRTGAAFIAYSYAWSFELPEDRVLATQRKHIALCRAMGPGRCQLLSSSNKRVDDRAEAEAELRIAPGAIQAFGAKIEAGVRDADGQVLASSVEGEDLTREIVDADAALKAKRTLRDRLQTLLERREGKLADLLAVEKSLSDTQQELDAATSLMAELHQRVDFSKVSLHYASRVPLTVGEQRWPLRDAFASASGTFGASLATLISLLVAATPWLVLAVLVFLGLRGLRRHRRRNRVL